MILGYDEYRGHTQMQDQALLQLEQLTINDMKYFVEYAAQYEELAAKTGRIYLQPEISEKFFRKLPPPFGSKMIELWNQAYPNQTVGIAPIKKFVFDVLQQLCQQNKINRQIKNFSFCKNIDV